MRPGTRVYDLLLFLLLFAAAGSGCRKEEASITPAEVTPAIDPRLAGTWFTRAKYSAAASEGYQFDGKGIVFRLVVDTQNKLQYDPLADPGQYNTPNTGLCTFIFTDKSADTVRTFTQTWTYGFDQNDSVLTLAQYPPLGPGIPTYQTFYVRGEIGQSVR